MTKQNYYFGFIVAVLLSAFLFIAAPVVFGAVTSRISTNNPREVQAYTLLNATTTNATSTNITDGSGSVYLAGAKKVTFFFTHGGTATSSTASSTLSVEVSGDNSTWIAYNKLIDNVTNSISQNLTRVASVTIEGATSTKTYSMDMQQDSFLYARCIATEPTAQAFTSGEHTCKALVEY